MHDYNCVCIMSTSHISSISYTTSKSDISAQLWNTCVKSSTFKKLTCYVLFGMERTYQVKLERKEGLGKTNFFICVFLNSTSDVMLMHPHCWFNVKKKPWAHNFSQQIGKQFNDTTNMYQLTDHLPYPYKQTNKKNMSGQKLWCTSGPTRDWGCGPVFWSELKEDWESICRRSLSVKYAMFSFMPGAKCPDTAWFIMSRALAMWSAHINEIK